MKRTESYTIYNKETNKSAKFAYNEVEQHYELIFKKDKWHRAATNSLTAEDALKRCHDFVEL